MLEKPFAIFGVMTRFLGNMWMLNILIHSQTRLKIYIFENTEKEKVDELKKQEKQKQKNTKKKDDISKCFIS